MENGKFFLASATPGGSSCLAAAFIVKAKIGVQQLWQLGVDWDEDLPPAIQRKWTIGRIIEVYPGCDGRVRNVKVKTSTGEYSRPVTKIAVIHPAEGHN